MVRRGSTSTLRFVLDAAPHPQIEVRTHQKGEVIGWRNYEWQVDGQRPTTFAMRVVVARRIVGEPTLRPEAHDLGEHERIAHARIAENGRGAIAAEAFLAVFAITDFGVGQGAAQAQLRRDEVIECQTRNVERVGGCLRISEERVAAGPTPAETDPRVTVLAIGDSIRPTFFADLGNMNRKNPFDRNRKIAGGSEALRESWRTTENY